MIMIKRIYEPFEPEDGCRILVDRLWPRGVRKEDAHFDLWMKEIAPSPELRKWFNHEPEKWSEFRKKYAAELKGSEALKSLLKIVAKEEKVTLLYTAKDEEFNHARALLQLIEKQKR